MEEVTRKSLHKKGGKYLGLYKDIDKRTYGKAVMHTHTGMARSVQMLMNQRSTGARQAVQSGRLYTPAESEEAEGYGYGARL